MREMIKAYIALDSEDKMVVLTLPDEVFAEKGDLIEHDGEMFAVESAVYLDKSSAEFRLIRSLTKFYEGAAVYSLRWSNYDG